MAPTLLDQLRSLGAVDCDTLDVDGEQYQGVTASRQPIVADPLPVAQKLGPFVDCTSNQVGSRDGTYPASDRSLLLTLSTTMTRKGDRFCRVEQDQQYRRPGAPRPHTYRYYAGPSQD
jgi:hypothetical protein